MALLGWAWLASPFAVIGLISHDRRLLALVAANLDRCRAAGWTGVAMMVLGVTVVHGTPGKALFWVGTPLIGLIVWLRGDDGDDGGQHDPDDVPPVDWEGFERSFWAYVARRGRGPSGRPRVPSAR